MASIVKRGKAYAVVYYEGEGNTPGTQREKACRIDAGAAPEGHGVYGQAGYL